MTARKREVAKALDTIAAELRGRITVGGEINGTLSHDDELDVEITIRVKRRVSYAKTQRYRDRALATWKLHRHHDSCPHYVKNREWSPGSKTHSCRGKVSVAIVHRVRVWEEGPFPPGVPRPFIDGERFEFVCSHHSDVNTPDVLAIVRLDKSLLDAERAKRRREDDEAHARARAVERALEFAATTLSDAELAERLREALAADSWRDEDVIRREINRRARTKPAAPPVSANPQETQ